MKLQSRAISRGRTARKRIRGGAPRQWTSVGAGALMALCAMAAEAQEEAALDAVVVTSQKREESAQVVPQTIDVIDGKLLLESGAGRTAGELTRFVPNASAATLDNHGFPRWFLRGIGTGEPSLNNVTPIGIYVDDVYFGSAFMTGGPLFDIQRIEVLPGPQGTLWGKNSPGGAIHTISRKPVFEDEGYVKADAGSRSARTVQGAINRVLKEDELALRVSFSSDRRDQFATNITKGQTGKLSDDALRIQLAANLTPELDALLNVHYRRFKQNDSTSYTSFGEPGTRDRYGNPYAVYPDRVFAFNAPTDTLREQAGGHLTLNWTRNGHTLTSITAFERATEDSVSDGDGLPQEISRSRSGNTIRQFSQEIRLASPRQDRLNWITGVHLYSQKIDSSSAGASLDVPSLYPGTVPTFTQNEWTQDNKSVAIFGSTTYALTDRLNITGGLRWTREQKSIDSRRDRSAGAVHFSNTEQWWAPGANNARLVPYVAFDNDRTWSALSGDITPEYRISDTLRTYLRVARGFRGGGFIASPTTQAGVGSYNPEYINAYELGFKSEWLDGRATLNGSVFVYDYKDIQVNIFKWDPALNQSVSRMQNAANAKVRGAEVQGTYAVTRNLRLRGAIGLLHTEYQDYRDSLGNDYSGRQFARAPRATGVLGVDYRIPLGDQAITLSGDINARSKFIFSATDAGNPAQQQAGYTLVNLRAGYQWTPKTTVVAYVDNATDKVYSQATNPTGPTTVGRALGAPRTVGLSLTHRW